MSEQARLIREGQIARKKQDASQAAINAKAALKALISAAFVAEVKPVANINETEMRSHLDRFREEQQKVINIQKEIEELE